MIVCNGVYGGRQRQYCILFCFSTVRLFVHDLCCMLFVDLPIVCVCVYVCIRFETSIECDMNI